MEMNGCSLQGSLWEVEQCEEADFLTATLAVWSYILFSWCHWVLKPVTSLFTFIICSQIWGKKPVVVRGGDSMDRPSCLTGCIIYVAISSHEPWSQQVGRKVLLTHLRGPVPQSHRGAKVAYCEIFHFCCLLQSNPVCYCPSPVPWRPLFFVVSH
jgi:hypothetical protein